MLYILFHEIYLIDPPTRGAPKKIYTSCDTRTEV